MPYGANIEIKGYKNRGRGSSPINVDFSADVQVGSAPLTVVFTNLSDNVDNYFWDFGDGYISEEETPSHIYNNPGIYAVTLIASNLISGYSIKTNQIIAYETNENGEMRITPNNPILREEGINFGHPRLISIDDELRLYYQIHGGIGFTYAVCNKDLTKWNYHTEWNNPVFAYENAGVPEGSTGIRMGNIFKVDDLYYLYYGSEPATNAYLATSTDGINFTPHPSNPILTPGEEDTLIGLPFVTKIDDTFYMYYTDFDTNFTHPVRHKVASSPNGINWTKEGLCYTLTSGGYDSTLIEDKTVFYDGTNIFILYEGYNGSFWSAGIVKGETPLGPFVKSSVPLLQKSSDPNAFDYNHIATPYIYDLNGNLILFYQGGNSEYYISSEFSFGLAFIDDLNSKIIIPEPEPLYFEDNMDNGSKWNSLDQWGNSDPPIYSGGIVTIPPMRYLQQAVALQELPVEIEARVKWSGNNSSVYWVGLTFGLNSGINEAFNLHHRTGQCQITYYDGNETVTPIPNIADGNFHDLHIIITNSGMTLTIDEDPTEYTISKDVTDLGYNTLYLVNHPAAPSGINFLVDYVKVEHVSP